MKSLEKLIIEEDYFLSDFSVKNRETIDRIYPEIAHPFRLPLHRDRDRIFHSRAFKRLEYKTQVFINSEGDNFRTRLTHSLEVAGVSRTIASALGLNSHLCEVIALSHDLGHTPFGHAGQDILSKLMKDFGGFEHNKQSLRIVKELESRYEDFPGLNLSRMSLIGLMKHGTDYEKGDLYILRNEFGPSMESLVTDYSDEIAYNTHDIEDAVERKIIQTKDLHTLKIWRFLLEKNQISEVEPNEKIFRKLLRSLMNEMVTDLIIQIETNLNKNSIKTREEFSSAWKNQIPIVEYSDFMGEMILELKKFLGDKVYSHPDVVSKSEKGQKIIEYLFHFLLKNPEKIPESFLKKREKDGIHRILSDYISGMTDRYAELKAKEFGGYFD
jgi:dGTPase